MIDYLVEEIYENSSEVQFITLEPAKLQKPVTFYPGGFSRPATTHWLFTAIAKSGLGWLFRSELLFGEDAFLRARSPFVRVEGANHDHFCSLP